MVYSFSFAGAGRVASALCIKMYSSGLDIRQIVSADASNGRSLAASCKALWSNELSYSSSNSIIIVAVTDHKLRTVLENIKCDPDTIVVHTAGSIGLDIFPDHMKRKGVFYPLQTFSKNREVNFSDLPFFLEGSDSDVRDALKDLAETIGGKIYFADTESRKALHLAAVFICNFTNHMLTAGKDIAARKGIAFDVFEHLIKETIDKALTEGPGNSQTGPAVRNDLNVIEKHLDLLSYTPEYRNVYMEITNSIIQYYKKK